MSTAARKGVSAVAAAADTQRVLLTSHGRTVAVVDSPERTEEQLRTLRAASLAVLDAAADLVADRSKKFNLDDACIRLGVDPERVRTRAATRSSSADDA
jgi:hypothetical protein